MQITKGHNNAENFSSLLYLFLIKNQWKKKMVIYFSNEEGENWKKHLKKNTIK